MENEHHFSLKNAKECLMGEGFDRHIFGLRHQATKNGLDLVRFRTFFNYRGAGYKTLLLAVYKTSLFFGGSEVAAYKTSLFFEVPKWLSIKPYFFLKAKFAKGLFPDLVVYKT